MIITLNGQAQEYNNNTLSVTALLDKEGYADKQIAIAINGQFIPRSSYDAHIINNNDEIEIVAPMQGG
jgi:sulfur carrier protein